MTLEKRIADLARHHGSLRALARTVRLDVGYLSRLASGEKSEPGDGVLLALGLERVVTYRLIRK